MKKIRIGMAIACALACLMSCQNAHPVSASVAGSSQSNSSVSASTGTSASSSALTSDSAVSSGSTSLSASDSSSAGGSSGASTSVETFFTVRFYNDAALLETDSVKKGADASYQGATPTKNSTPQYTYTFSGWDKSLANIMADTDFYAQYTSTVKTYTIRFLDADSAHSVLQSSSVAYGATPTYTGETPTKAPETEYVYTFAGWTPEIMPVTEAADYTATYTQSARAYTIRFLNDDGTELEKDSVNYGETPAYSGTTPTKTNTAQYSYTFAAWDPAIVAVVADADYTATYTNNLRSYTVKFVNDDDAHTVLQESTYDYGATPVYNGLDPTKVSTAQYSYAYDGGWSPALGIVTGDITYVATYTRTIRKYTITFTNWDDSVISTSTMEYGTTPAYPKPNPTHTATQQYRYTFTGYSPNLTMVTGDATYKAQYHVITQQYTITFKNYDGTTLETKDWDYGSTPSYSGDTPVRTTSALSYKYVFSSWTPAIVPVTIPATYTAVFTTENIYYTATFLNWNGTLLGTQQVLGGSTPSYTGTAPTKAEDKAYQSYTHSGWNPALAAITADTTYTAVFTGNNQKTYSTTFTSSSNHASSYTIPSGDASQEYHPTAITYSAGGGSGAAASADVTMGFCFINSSMTFKDTTDAMVNLTTADSTTATEAAFEMAFFFEDTATITSATLHFSVSATTSLTLAECDMQGYTTAGDSTTLLSLLSSSGTTLEAERPTISNKACSQTMNPGSTKLAGMKTLHFRFSAQYTGTLTISVVNSQFTFTY